MISNTKTIEDPWGDGEEGGKDNIRIEENRVWIVFSLGNKKIRNFVHTENVRN